VPLKKNGSFGAFMRDAKAAGRLVVQPRMGFSDPARMRRGLLATRELPAATVGTITLDSYTRLGDNAAAARALAEGSDLNGYPIVAHPAEVTRDLLAGVHDETFPVQVRHGSAQAGPIVAALVDAGLTATEGGPVSYCLPYGRVPLRESVAGWARCCELLADSAGDDAHLETFGGCMLGQLCPPSLLIALSVLEAMFFCGHGVRSVSLSYAQQTNADQDAEAIAALRRLAGEFVPATDLHLVLYAYMGVYPRTADGALGLLAEAARLAVRTGVERLIVKTVAEAHRIPTIAENTQALWTAARAADEAVPAADPGETEIYAEARALVEAVLDLDVSVGPALLRAFERGVLDVPFCLHPDNAGTTRSYLDGDGRLRWAVVGSLPIDRPATAGTTGRMTAGGLLTSLTYVQRKFDHLLLDRHGPAVITAG
jgi:methylaspartate mutase epsilon subunit